jgi:translation initiation factor 1
MSKKQKRIPLSDSSSGRLGSLGDFLKQAGYTPSNTEDEGELKQADDNKKSPKPAHRSDTEKIIIRKERKGRGGKTVTFVEGLHRTEPELKEMAKKMRKSLGCGSTVEGSCIVLQGDQVVRATTWLAENGLKTTIS